eukprot:CFRG5185T1
MGECFERAKFGAMMGGSLGLSLGFMFGAATSLRVGARGREFVQITGSTMVQSGAAFGFFLAVGSALRC